MKGKRNFAMVMITITIILPGCAATEPKSKNTVKNNLAQLEKATGSDSLVFREVFALFSIIDSKFARKLATLPNLNEFISSVEEYKAAKDLATRPDTPDRNEWWEEILKRLDYGHAHYATSIFDRWRDVRWEALIPLGIPSHESVGEGQPKNKEDLKVAAKKRARGGPPNEINKNPVDVYRLTWDSLGIEIICESGPVGGYPLEFIPGRRIEGKFEDPLGDKIGRTSGDPDIRIQTLQEASERATFQSRIADIKNNPPRVEPFPELEKAIKSYVDFFSLLGLRDSTYDIYAATLTPGDQFSEQTVADGFFGARLSVYNQKGELVGYDTASVGGLLRLASLTKNEVKENAFRAYRAAVELPKGEYKSVVSVNGANEKNIGVYWETVRVPSPQTSGKERVSDIVLCFPSDAMSGQAIQRNGLLFWVNPISVCYEGDKIYPYVEFQILADSFKVEWLLVPVGKGHMKSKVETGPIVEVKDTSGVIWGKTGLPDEIQKSGQGKDDGKSITLYSDFAMRPQGKTGFFYKPLVVPVSASGKYYLLARFSSPQKGQFFGLAWKEIEIRKGENPANRSASK